jgi:hypothetical protein
VPPPTTAMLSLSAQRTSASRIGVSCPARRCAEWQTPVEISIMLEVISGTTLPGQRRSRHQAQHLVGVGREVVVVRVDQLQLELDAQRQRRDLWKGSSDRRRRVGGASPDGVDVGLIRGCSQASRARWSEASGAQGTELSPAGRWPGGEHRAHHLHQQDGGQGDAGDARCPATARRWRTATPAAARSTTAATSRSRPRRPGASWCRCRGWPASTPAILATARRHQASTTPATAGFQSACAATTDTSTNISMVSSEAAVPSWRGQAQGRG